MLINKENKDYKINSFNVSSIVILSTFAILLLYLSNAFLSDNTKQAWADSVITTIPLGPNPFAIAEPYGVAYDPNDSRVYVADFGINSVSVIDTKTNTVNATISDGSGIYDVAYDSHDGRVYVTNYGTSSVSVIDTKTNTVNATITVGTQPYGIAYDPNDGWVYVTNYGSNTVSVIDTKTNTVITTIPVGFEPTGVAYD
ncbi:MAG TPA: YncE family protein, partial [Candidatus Nitrosocosmicus sp.]